MTSASDEKWRHFNCLFTRVGLRTYQHPCTGSELISTVEEESELWGIDCDDIEINLCSNEIGCISDVGYVASVSESVCVRNAS